MTIENDNETRERVGRQPSPRGAPSTADAFSDLSENLSALVRNHLLLARMELRQELRGLLRDAILQVGGLPFLFLGYCLLIAGASAALGLAVPIWAALLIVGGIHLLAGVGLLAFGLIRMRKARLRLPASAEELKKDRDLARRIGSSELSEPPSRELH